MTRSLFKILRLKRSALDTLRAARRGWTNRDRHLVAVSVSPPPIPERIERPLVGLFVLVVLFLVIMPGLLYLVGWGVKRLTEETPSWIGFPTAPERRSKKTGRRGAAKG